MEIKDFYTNNSGSTAHKSDLNIFLLRFIISKVLKFELSWMENVLGLYYLLDKSY